jgi:hypothetical protein
MSTIVATLREALALREQLALEGLDSYYLHLDDGYHVIAWSQWVARHTDDDPSPSGP